MPGADGAPRRPPRWGERPSLVRRLMDRLGLRARAPQPREALPALPLALRHGELAERYLAAAADSDHRRAGTSALAALEAAVGEGAWWAADAWGHRALWHFEQAQMPLAAVRTARRIGELRAEAGDPLAARRYYAEAISEARDLGAEREEALAALGLGRAELQLANVTTARRLGGIAADLLERIGAPEQELAAARELRGSERPVGEGPAAVKEER